MFSRDNKHYRQTPRTLNDAFGPYARFDESYEETGIVIRVAVSLGVIACGVIYGLLMGWRG